MTEQVNERCPYFASEVKGTGTAIDLYYICVTLSIKRPTSVHGDDRGGRFAAHQTGEASEVSLYAVSDGLEHFAWPAVMLVVIELLMLGCAQAAGLPRSRPRGFCQRRSEGRGRRANLACRGLRGFPEGLRSLTLENPGQDHKVRMPGRDR